MAKSISSTHKRKPTLRAGNFPGSARNLKHEDLIPVSIRLKMSQVERLDNLAGKLLMQKSDIMRIGVELALEWAAKRAEKLK